MKSASTSVCGVRNMLFRKLCHKCCSKKSRASYITHGVPPPEVEDGSFSEESDDVKMQRLERSLEADPLADHARRFLRKGFRQKAAPGRKEAGTGEVRTHHPHRCAQLAEPGGTDGGDARPTSPAEHPGQGHEPWRYQWPRVPSPIPLQSRPPAAHPTPKHTRP